MKLYDMRLAPNPRRVRIFLAEKGIEVPMVEVNIRSGENLQPDFLAVNPRGLLPTLQLDDGTIIDESTAICRYFEEMQPEPPLMGSTPVEKALVECWTRRMEFDAGLPLVDAFRNSYPAYAAERAVPGRTGSKAIPELAERGRSRLADFYPTIEQRLGESAYVAGPDFSAADIALLCITDFARALKMPIPEDLPDFARWHAAVSKRPSAKA